MKILAVADKEDPRFWDFYDPARTAGLDLILSCGDLDPDYLQFLVTMTSCPVLYVRGNHDRRYDRRPPEGCIGIDDRVYDFRGLRILGLGGSMRYQPGASDMYTEQEMCRRIRRLKSRIAMTNGFDVLVTHAPCRGYGDMEDLPHQGFDCFNELLMRWKPKYMLYGHVHKEYGEFQRETEHESGTKLINAYESHFFSVGDDEHPPKGRTGSALYDLYISLQERKNRGRFSGFGVEG